MDDALFCTVMKAERVQLLLLMLVLGLTSGMLYLRPSTTDAMDGCTGEGAVQPRTADPIPSAGEPTPVTAPETADEAVSSPVQSVAERRDAMLFESEALNGTPFDRAVVMPFD